MNLNGNLNLSLKPEDLKKLLPIIAAVRTYVVGVALVVVFGYTAYEINKALNVQASASTSSLQALPKVAFDQKTISSLKSLNEVGGSVPLTGLGTTNPLQ